MSYKVKGDLEVQRRLSADLAINTPEWVTGKNYLTNDIFMKDGQMFTVLAPYTSPAVFDRNAVELSLVRQGPQGLEEVFTTQGSTFNIDGTHVDKQVNINTTNPVYVDADVVSAMDRVGKVVIVSYPQPTGSEAAETPLIADTSLTGGITGDVLLKFGDIAEISYSTDGLSAVVYKVFDAGSTTGKYKGLYSATASYLAGDMVLYNNELITVNGDRAAANYPTPTFETGTGFTGNNWTSTRRATDFSFNRVYQVGEYFWEDGTFGYSTDPGLMVVVNTIDNSVSPSGPTDAQKVYKGDRSLYRGDWTPSIVWEVGDLMHEAGKLYRCHTYLDVTMFSGPFFLYETANFEVVSTGTDAVFVNNTNMAPAQAGSPTVAELEATTEFTGGSNNTFYWYNGTDTDGGADKATHLWFADNSKEVVIVNNARNEAKYVTGATVVLNLNEAQTYSLGLPPSGTTISPVIPSATTDSFELMIYNYNGTAANVTFDASLVYEDATGVGVVSVPANEFKKFTFQRSQNTSEYVTKNEGAASGGTKHFASFSGVSPTDWASTGTRNLLVSTLTEYAYDPNGLLDGSGTLTLINAGEYEVIVTTSDAANAGLSLRVNGVIVQGFSNVDSSSDNPNLNYIGSFAASDIISFSASAGAVYNVRISIKQLS